MARRSLRPQLNQIRTWVRQGRTDAWIAHQLEVSARDITNFKREHDLEAGEAAEAETDLYGPRVDEEEVDLRAEDERLVAAALEEEEREAEEGAAGGDGDGDSEETDTGERKGSRRRRGRRDDAVADDSGDGDDAGDSDDSGDRDEEGKARRRRGRRGGRGRKRGSGPRQPLEGTFDHGEDGYGLWLDPAVQDDAVYAEHWAGHRQVTVTIEADRIVIERTGGDGDGDGDDGDGS